MGKPSGQGVLLKSDAWQRLVIYLLLAFHIVIPWTLAICWKFLGWGKFPTYLKFEIDWYNARVELLKYAISICFSIIGATWFLASTRKGDSQLSEKTRFLLSWGWTFIGVGIISATLQMFLSYKQCYGWKQMLEQGGYPNLYQEVRHCAYIYMLKFSHRFAVGPMFFGGILVLLSLTGVLMKPQNSSQTGGNNIDD